jgi:crossover junction endodeoxyribonuclease RuvC
LFKIFESISEIIEQYSPAQIAMEKIFVDKNVASALKLGQARGAALVACAKCGLDIADYTPRQIKKSVVGYGHADKKQVQEMIRILLKLSGIPQADAADALAVAVCHANLGKGLLSYTLQK